MIAVTGAAGFIGSHAARALAAASEKLSLLTGPASDSRPFDPSIAERCLQGDIEHVSILDVLLDGADTVVHAAGPPSVVQSFHEPAEYVRVHAVGTARVLEACLRHKVRRIVYISSAEIYGPQTTPVVDESHPIAAASPYGAAKAGAELIIRAFAAAGRIEAVTLRLFSIYGPGMSTAAVVSEFLSRAYRKESIRVRNPRPVRDFCFVEDVARAIVAACTKPCFDSFATVNIGSGVGTRIGDLAQLAANLAGALGVESGSENRAASAEVDCLIANIARAEQLFGWRPTTSLERGLQKTLDWMRAS